MQQKPPPNNGMQRSADTTALIYGKGAARPLMPGVSCSQLMNLMRRMIRIIIFTTATLLCLPFIAAAQKQTLKPIEGGIGVADKPLNCEMTLQLMEDVRDLIKAEADGKSVLILIARLGNGERSRTLNSRRLHNVREGFQVTLGIVKPIVIAEGERVNGFGRVEVYIGGKFIGALLARKNSHVIKCEW